MHKRIQLLTIVIFIMALHLSAQNDTNSPYTRFGYGELSDNTNGTQRSMGGLSIATRSNKDINTANPASYTSVDSLTFMFDIGASAFATLFTDNAGQRTHINGNLEYITLQFPLGKYLGFSAGLLPYSSVGYNFSQTDSVSQSVNPGVSDTQIHYAKSFYGEGGITQVYSGLSVELFKRLSVGVNVYYMFGSIEHNRRIGLATNYITINQLNSLRINNFRFRYGLQYYDVFAKKHAITIGAIYEHKTELNGRYEQTVAQYTGSSNSEIGRETLQTSSEDVFDLPGLISGGIYYTYNNSLSLGIDYHYQMWSNARYYGATDSFKDRTKLALGAEYIHNPLGRRYFDRIAFRAGVNLSDSYLSMQKAKDYGVTFGVGLPLRNSKSMINASFEYNKRGAKTLLREDQFKFTLSTSINEIWFFKRKL